MERPFFLTWGGLWFFVFLVAGHVAGYTIVRFTRRRRWNDFVAVLGGCFGLSLAGLSDLVFHVWYVHAAGFGVLMGTVMFLASTLGKEG
jgi:hypothetical protein